uniref:Uncharacterized protein n=1 Tax=Photinus pyralis TaxID=7054 RepID=A0A1Y1M2J9_PHOPY
MAISEGVGHQTSVVPEAEVGVVPETDMEGEVGIARGAKAEEGPRLEGHGLGTEDEQNLETGVHGPKIDVVDLKIAGVGEVEVVAENEAQAEMWDFVSDRRHHRLSACPSPKRRAHQSDWVIRIEHRHHSRSSVPKKETHVQYLLCSYRREFAPETCRSSLVPSGK